MSIVVPTVMATHTVMSSPKRLRMVAVMGNMRSMMMISVGMGTNIRLPSRRQEAIPREMIRMIRGDGETLEEASK
jgi:hypothetical protein